MKRTGRILLIVALVIMTVTLSIGTAFADGTEGGLKLERTYPADEATGAAIENFDVKLYFDGVLTDEVLGDKNDDCFELTDADGNKLPLIVLYDPKNPGVMMVLFDYNTEKKDSEGNVLRIKGDTEYTLKISKDLMADNGDTLGQDQSITFKTINQSRNSLISMGMMLILYAGIIFFTMRNAKKKAEDDKSTNGGYQPVNPYKEAKRTGKSVEEIIEKENKKKEKAAQKAARAAEEEDDDEDYEPYIPEGHYRVKTLRTVASGGSTYITGRKAAAEEKAAREARYAANAKKGKKGKKK
jgi:hypothetical protein